MERALELGARGEGRVEPNPMVGCVLVRSGRVIGEGFHRRFGGPHAEVEALRSCRTSPRGATCYVTLEPCCHYGKTPPCTEALLNAGVSRVVVGLEDPFSKVSGRGIRRLRSAGVRVDVGLLAERVRVLNAPFLKLQRTRTPWVILKWAQSVDGKIATRTGDSKWITSPASRRDAHALRARVDAVVVGIGTVLADDPMLTARGVRTLRTAVRIVLDSKLRIPIRSRLVRSAQRVPLIVATCAPASGVRARRLIERGIEVLRVRPRRGRVDLRALLRELGRRSMTNVMVEGGGRVLGAFVDSGLADEACIYVAPRLIGGRDALGSLEGVGPARTREAPEVCVTDDRLIGADRRLRLGFVRHPRGRDG